MKKVLLFAAFAGMVSLYACKKGETTTITKDVHDTTTNTVTVFASGKINGDSLSTAINIAYGTRISDSTLPAASTDADAPVLDTTYSRTYSVVRSRYLTIYPPNVSGYVAGYYVQIVGAKSYFKIDYPAAEGLRKAARKDKLARLSKATNGRISAKNISGARGTGDGYIDSTIVLKLPASVNGDTFFIKYVAYDLQNRVSKPVTATVVFLPEGSAGMTDSLTGDWHYYSYRDYNNGQYDGDWSVDTGYASYQYYTCDGTTLTGTEALTNYYLPYNTYTYTWTYQLGKFSMLSTNNGVYKYLDLESSTCSNYVYNINDRWDDDDYIGGYSYDPISKKITFISDGNSSLDLNYDSYYLSELTDSTMVLSYSRDDEDSNSKELYKFIKK
jgi:hypothetical protein